jgi:ATP-binding cassette subfamily B protein
VRQLKRLIIFEKGRIIEDGDHHGLIKREAGTYRRLFQRQVGGLVEA